MSTPAMVPEILSGDEVATAPASGQSSGQVAARILSGTSTLGASLAVERGCGFLANILAARFATAPVFGAYSLAVGTANTISTYAAGNIGSTAARFSGKYPFGGTQYKALARALAVVSLASALLAALSLWLGAGPIAILLHKPNMTNLLRWAGISAVGIILLECVRGFFVGQRRLIALLVLSLCVGVGMLTFLPTAAHMHRPTRMIISQGLVSLGAVAVCLLLAKQLRLRSPRSATEDRSTVPVLREVWSFGLIQLAGLAGANLSGWWLTALVARADSTLVQMSFLTIASQMRNLTGLLPGLLTEGSYAVMADPEGEQRRTPHQVMAFCTFATTACTVLIACLGMLVVPWLLTRLYGSTYTGAAAATAMALAVAVAHMGNAPVVARLSIVSVKAVGIINGVWAVLVAISATILFLRGGSASLAMSIFFGAHVCSAGLSLLVLSRKERVAGGMWSLFFLGMGSVTGMALLFHLRQIHPGSATVLSGTMFLGTVVIAGALYALGKQHNWLPRREAVTQLLRRVPVLRSLAWRPAHGS